MTDKELSALNEKLKSSRLSDAEWAAVDAFVSENDSDYVSNVMGVKYPFLAMKYKKSKSGYGLFLSIVASELNKNPDMIHHGFVAKMEKNEEGDGSGHVLTIRKNGHLFTKASLIEEYLSFTQRNGASTLGDTIERISATLVGFRGGFHV